MKTKSTGGDEDRVLDWFDHARRLLYGAPEIDAQDAGFEAQLLLSHVLEKPRAWVIAHPEEPIPVEIRCKLDNLLAQRVEGTPLPYLLGKQEFFGLAYEITPDVLIPRPETELLVEQALNYLADRPNCRAADVGTGSGCIAVSLLVHRPELRLLAVDRSAAALRVARRNAARHGVAGRALFAQSDLLTAAAGPFDLVCANLPYIPHSDLPGLAVSRHEPRLALDGGDDGLELIRRLIADAPRWLKPGGQMLLEMQYDQADTILQLANRWLPEDILKVLPDLAGLPRVVTITR